MSLHDTVVYDEWVLDILFLTISHASQALHLLRTCHALLAQRDCPFHPGFFCQSLRAMTKADGIS